MENITFDKVVKRDTHHKKTRRVIKWLIQSLLWVFILIAGIFSQHILTTSHKLLTWLLITLCIYICYIITSLFASKTWIYLKHKHKNNSIEDYMKKLFYSYPKVFFVGESYYLISKNEKGKSINNRVITHTEMEDFNYYSSRDNSEDFVLDISKNNLYFIKLSLDLTINYADPITILDYETKKSIFRNENQKRDKHFKLYEKCSLQELDKFNLVKLTNQEPLFINVYCYLICVFIFPLVEIYKIYFNSFCKKQAFTIKKVISTRYDLNQTASERSKDDNDENEFKFHHLNNKNISSITNDIIGSIKDKVKFTLEHECPDEMEFVKDNQNNILDNKQSNINKDHKNNDNKDINMNILTKKKSILKIKKYGSSHSHYNKADKTERKHKHKTKPLPKIVINNTFISFNDKMPTRHEYFRESPNEDELARAKIYDDHDLYINKITLKEADKYNNINNRNSKIQSSKDQLINKTDDKKDSFLSKK